ncbi:hypothetical protein [Fluviicola chungangensis]|uniref:RHS repeat protein n=1 Tax=Fluviicola chungangensis TaxID=2597671 RepID=A0A556MPI7_9FLAO|nr:hypothetical protein [Fluviicola chungangensis]TSJ41863.1 hypothetical protein FO442_12280 [Fluviicola chungangensis]
MKYIVFSILITCLGFCSIGQVDAPLKVYNSCVTAAEVCNTAVDVFCNFGTNDSFCTAGIDAQYFKFNMLVSGSITLNTYGHTGTYTLYKPDTGFGISVCEQLDLGQVTQVSTGNLAGSIPITMATAGYYILRVKPTNCITSGSNKQVHINVGGSSNANCRESVTCKDCLGTFAPGAGQYLVSAWVKGESQNKNTSYVNPSLTVSFVGSTNSFTFSPSGPIIDEWQRIEGIATIPANATEIKIELKCQTGNCLFDDIRFIPNDGSMISYVYDPVTLKLTAQLDERNFATLYEYDEEGQLIRTKKETEKGIMTIQENRNNIQKP